MGKPGQLPEPFGCCTVDHPPSLTLHGGDDGGAPFKMATHAGRRPRVCSQEESLKRTGCSANCITWGFLNFRLLFCCLVAYIIVAAKFSVE